MTLDRAIVYYDELTKAYCEEADLKRDNYMDMRDKAYEYEQLAEWLKELKELREQKHCEDAISRQAAIDIANSEGAYGYISAYELGELPSVKPDVTHCGDCENSDCSGLPKGRIYCMKHGCYFDENGFCSDGSMDNG